MSFIAALTNAGWVELQPSVHYRKGTWEIVFDTSSWMEVGTANNARVFDVPVPEHGREQWCLDLIEHLCKSDDRICELTGQSRPPSLA